MSRLRLELLQWFALLGGALAWTAVHVVGFGFAEGGCAVAGAQWDFHLVPMQVTLVVLAGLTVVAAEASAVFVYRETKDVDVSRAPGPYGRMQFFAQAAILGNVLFFVIVLLDAIGALYHVRCHQA